MLLYFEQTQKTSLLLLKHQMDYKCQKAREVVVMHRNAIYRVRLRQRIHTDDQQ